MRSTTGENNYSSSNLSGEGWPGNMQETVPVTLMVRMPRLAAALRFGPRSSRKMDSEGCTPRRSRHSLYILGSGLVIPSRQDSTTWGGTGPRKMTQNEKGFLESWHKCRWSWVLGIEPKALCMRGTCATTEPLPPSPGWLHLLTRKQAWRDSIG